MSFQSTPPCGGDKAIKAIKIQKKNFNPRPLAGATVLGGVFVADVGISIHAPLRGRHDTAEPFMYLIQFQSTPPCGGDPDQPERL